MNYYNPYFTSYPYAAATGARTGLFSRLFGGINMSSILSGTQKTLNIVNQTIPLIKQASPMIKNAKTMFRVMNEFKKVDTPVNVQTNINDEEKKLNKNIAPTKEDDSLTTNNGPTFFA